MYNDGFFLLCTQLKRITIALGGTIAVTNGDHGVVEINHEVAIIGKAQSVYFGD